MEPWVLGSHLHPGHFWVMYRQYNTEKYELQFVRVDNDYLVHFEGRDEPKHLSQCDIVAYIKVDPPNSPAIIYREIVHKDYGEFLEATK